jgi:hypothetical protein
MITRDCMAKATPIHLETLEGARDTLGMMITRDPTAKATPIRLEIPEGARGTLGMTIIRGRMEKETPIRLEIPETTAEVSRYIDLLGQAATVIDTDIQRRRRFQGREVYGEGWGHYW